MPELPEVETVRRGLTAAMEGRRIEAVRVNRPDLRIPFPPNMAKALTGRTVTALRRRAKYLLIDLDDGNCLIVHLGMSGRMVIEPVDGDASMPGGFHQNVGVGEDTPDGPHDHVVFQVGNGTVIRFADPRRFGLMDLCPVAELESHRFFKALGPEPVSEDFTGPVLAAALAGKRTPIKSALLDQRVVAGLGNIYVCEGLYMAGLSPRRQAYTVQGRRADRLVDAIKSVLADAIAAGGSTLRDHVTPSGEIGYFQHSFKVYDREGAPCPGCDCGGAVRRIVQAGRSTFYCAVRQR